MIKLEDCSDETLSMLEWLQKVPHMMAFSVHLDEYGDEAICLSFMQYHEVFHARIVPETGFTELYYEVDTDVSEDGESGLESESEGLTEETSPEVNTLKYYGCAWIKDIVTVLESIPHVGHVLIDAKSDGRVH